MLKLQTDKNWNVRRQLAASLGELPVAARVDPAVALLTRDGADPIIVDATVSSLKDVEADVLDARHAEQGGAARRPPKPSRC